MRSLFAFAVLATALVVLLSVPAQAALAAGGADSAIPAQPVDGKTYWACNGNTCEEKTGPGTTTCLDDSWCKNVKVCRPDAATGGQACTWGTGVADQCEVLGDACGKVMTCQGSKCLPSVGQKSTCDSDAQCPVPISKCVYRQDGKDVEKCVSTFGRPQDSNCASDSECVGQESTSCMWHQDYSNPSSYGYFTCEHYGVKGNHKCNSDVECTRAVTTAQSPTAQTPTQPASVQWAIPLVLFALLGLVGTYMLVGRKEASESGAPAEAGHAQIADFALSNSDKRLFDAPSIKRSVGMKPSEGRRGKRHAQWKAK